MYNYNINIKEIKKVLNKNEDFFKIKIMFLKNGC